MKIRKGFISNSSSSSFICDYYLFYEKTYTVEETKKILQKIIDFYNDIEGLNLSFEEIFQQPYIGSKKDVKKLDDFFGREDSRHKRANNKIIINSIKDNSIPYLMIGIIEAKFDAFRFHLG